MNDQRSNRRFEVRILQCLSDLHHVYRPDALVLQFRHGNIDQRGTEEIKRHVKKAAAVLAPCTR